MKISDNLGGGWKYTPQAQGKIQPLRDNVIVEEMEFGIQTTSKGLIIPSDDGSNHGIKPRWARVHAIGPDQTEIKVGEYVLVEHGRWTRGIELVDDETGESKTVRMVEVSSIMATSETPMSNGIGTMTGA